MSFTRVLLGLCVLHGLFACRLVRPPRAFEPATNKGAAVVDSGGRRVEAVEVGSTLSVAVGGLEPFTMYELRVRIGDEPARTTGEALSYARTGSDRRGGIAATTLWYHSGVVGCASRFPTGELPRFTYRTFDEAEQDLAGRTFTVSVHPVEADPTGRVAPHELEVGEAVFVERVPFAPRRSPMVFPSNASGLLCNAAEVGTEDIYVSGRNFKPGTNVLVSVVPNQRRWHVGDAVRDATGPGGGQASRVARVDDSGRFTVRAWEANRQFRGTFDLIAQPFDPDDRLRPEPNLRPEDLVSYAADTAFVFYLIYPVGGPTMDLAGRPLSGSPYFQFADSFAETNDDVWAAVDPTYVPAGHPGGNYAAYYVVDHKSAPGWDPMMGGSTALVDVSGGIEIHRVKSGCVNGTDTIVWHAPLDLGEYDVVVDFGPSPAEDAGTYLTDFSYDAALDFLDGADQIGFVVAPDPYELGPFPIGEATYDFEDFYPSFGGASDVDLRAVVRYPAVIAGTDTQPAMGQHPLFLIEHGNHGTCEGPDVCEDHATCPVKTVNHEGYMRLLEILASHGVIAVSIDAYDVTGCVPYWIEERGDLILGHIEFWSHLDDPTTFTGYTDPFSGRFQNAVDLSKISVSGHSRGGEASVAAYMRNVQGFSINSVSSIAPVDVVDYTLPAVPYFVILPAADGDVWDLSGQRIYDRAGGGIADATTKSGIHVFGANHNFFNTVWADDGDDSDPARVDYIPAADQQRLGEAYLAAFTRVHLLGETVYEDMLRGQLVFPSTAGFKIFPIHHETNHDKLEDGSSANVTASAGATESSVSDPSVHETQALEVAWSGGAGLLDVTGGPWDATGFEVLSFRVTQTNDASNPAGDQDFVVELIGGGNDKRVFASKHGRIPKPYSITAGGFSHNVMTTIRMPLHSFLMNNSGVTLNAIDTIRFRFDSYGPDQGEIYVDDIEFSR